MARRYIDQVLRTAALEELRNGAEQRAVARKYGIAESTISRWKKQENIETGPYASAVIRSKPLKKKESSGSAADQRTLNQKMQSLIDDLLEEGGLKSSDIRNLAQASKVLGEADARLEKEEQAKAAQGSLGKGNSGAPTLDDLVGCYPEGGPRNFEIYFGVLDIKTAQENGDREAEADAKSRVRQACVAAGLPPSEIDFDAMMDRIQQDFVSPYVPRGEGS